MNIRILLLELGFLPRGYGYKYLLDLLQYALHNQIFPLNRYGYQYLSQTHKKSVDTIDKCIQNSISAAILRSTESFYTLFSYSIDANKGKPTNKQFIATILEKINCSN